MTKNSELSSTTKCRICLTRSKQLKSLKKGIIDRKRQKKSYGQLLKEVTNINIMDKKYRKMPQFICTYCLRKLKLAHIFLQQAQRTHDKLWYMLQKEQKAKIELECLQETQIDMQHCFKVEIEEDYIEKLLEENLENEIQFDTVAKEEFDIMDDNTYFPDLDPTQIDIIKPQNNDVNEPTKQYACEHCEASYTTKYRLTYHLRKIHNIEANSKEITPTKIVLTSQSLQQYTCKHCESHFKTSVRLICHLKDKHNIVENFNDKLQHEQFEIEDQKELDSMDDTSIPNNNTSSVEINNSQEEESNAQERFYCEKCNLSYTKKFILNRHIREKHQPKSKETIKSTTVGSNTGNIMDLPISFTGYRCTKCSLKFDTQLRLIQHFKHHAADEKSYNSDQYVRTTPKTKEKPCIQKGKPCVPKEKNIVFKKENPHPSSGLSSHSLVDSEVKRFQCKFCEKSFDKSTQLSVHMRVHTYDRPFKCNECHKAYTKSWDLRIHQRKHTGEKPYTCGYCQMSFALTHSLKQHQKKCPNF